MTEQMEFDFVDELTFNKEEGWLSLDGSGFTFESTPSEEIQLWDGRTLEIPKDVTPEESAKLTKILFLLVFGYTGNDEDTNQLIFDYGLNRFFTPQSSLQLQFHLD
jgi:hypothetical protein